ncbi:DUF6531 domain-containing protein [Luteimonas terricola]|uniref:DUF6531 domain-containing protein n=1 Tax=Luteimonas terricola TaxID=645597 RepID=A0ABQ2EBI6_9GAMM|nr:DUF6531 domain-containing protein [Luteimonas terricola]GGK04746.1 hypothetical protein GCM10011394_12310 [Luteimonas terricola]
MWLEEGDACRRSLIVCVAAVAALIGYFPGEAQATTTLDPIVVKGVLPEQIGTLGGSWGVEIGGYQLQDGGFSGNTGQLEQLGDKDAGTRGCDKSVTGNPVVISTGNKTEPELDFDAGGLRLERVWNQHWDGVGIFGYHWLSSFDFKLSFGGSYENGPCYPINGEAECQTAASATIIWAHRPDGRKIRFLKQSEGVFFED